MQDNGRQAHWNEAYATKGEKGVSWYEDAPMPSLDLMRQCGATAKSSLIDIGGGASRLVDALLAQGMHDLAVLDLSAAALDVAEARLGAAAAQVEWIVSDITAWQPARTYDFWHDRAAFHFLIRPEDRAAYVERLHAAVKPHGHAIIATFAPDGPEKCSGLPVMRYDPQALAGVIGPHFQLVDERRHVHTTPWGSTQSFQFSVFRHLPESGGSRRP
ncbi:methyltransferase family protein [Pseudaminobacter salicylatoxidans]|uniref:Methyltransferase family protein n=1 Tax=Pseudaminobacter salicylatoxidans TaxID=93369 RepID=A0A316C709_PSESE|nr:class I SAM-dependent methyltransferase [Pseudaminobacter salicylatoxidans]PWJ85063.1 methyltransferase family protein [Pseudaminobacter salicylatoxidans]